MKKRYLLTNGSYVYYNVVWLLGEPSVSSTTIRSNAIVYLAHEVVPAREALWRKGYKSTLKEVSRGMIADLLNMEP